MSIKNNFKKTIVNMAILMSFSSIVVAGGGNPSVSLSQTVGTDLAPGACAASSVLSVNLGTSVNFCYTVTNDGDEDFALQSLTTSSFGDMFTNVAQTLAVGDSLIFSDVRTLSSDVINDSTWTAAQSPFTVTTGGFEDISLTGTLETELADDGEVNLTIPFPFDYFGTVSTDLRVGNNGGALFGVTVGQVEWNNNVGFGDPVALGMIAPHWDDIGVSATTGDLFTETLGTAPNRRFIVQWHQEIFFNGADPDNVTFQMVLFETTNEIQFRYLDVFFGGVDVGNDQGLTASIGIVSPDGSTIFEYSHNGSTLLNDGDVISVFPVAGGLLSASDSSTAAVSILVPQVEATPNPINASVASAGMGSETLVISNSGVGSLTWSVDEASDVARTPSTKPISFYNPVSFGDQSFGADKAPAGKFNPAMKAGNNISGGGPVAFAYDIRNGFFGSIDHTNPDDFNQIVADANPFFAGDFVDGDYTTLYAINNDDRGLYSVNTADGVATLVNTLTPDPVGETISGISQDPIVGTVYVNTTNGTQSFLYTIDLVTAALTSVGEVTNSALLIDIAVNQTGDMYGLDIGSDSLIAIDKVSGAGTVVGGIGVDISFAQGLDFDDSTNTLYMTGYIGGGVNEVRTIDLLTGASTLVGSVNGLTGGAELDAFGIAADPEPCFLGEDIPWLSLSPENGVVGSGDTDDVTVSFDATALADGLYSANVCLFSDDPDETLVKIPVSLQVGPTDLIFANGFE